MKITVCLISFLLQRFAYDKHLQVIFSTEKQELEKSTQMHVNLECSSRKYKSARASSFGKCLKFPIRTANSYTNVFPNLLLGPMQFPKFEALADLYFRALHSRFTCICVLFSTSCFSVEKIT